MKKNGIKIFTVLLIAGAIAGTLMMGCADKAAQNAAANETTVESASVENASAENASSAVLGVSKQPEAEIPAAPYFIKGVYVNYAKEAENPAKTYFYVFNDETYGHTEDGEHDGIGLPFEITQNDGSASFTFGGATEPAEVFTVSSCKDGIITGSFDDGIELVFELVQGQDPETFSSENYVNGPENSVYHDANGWSVKYDATKFEINQSGPQVFIVYTGDCAGSNLITVTYTVDNKAEEAIKELGKAYGDKAEYTEWPFPGVSDVTGYNVSVPVDKEGSGSYMTAFARDYMDGALIFETDGHDGNDEEMNTEVHAALTGVLNSLTFDFE
jgi:hypothetical protein